MILFNRDRNVPIFFSLINVHIVAANTVDLVSFIILQVILVLIVL